MIDEKESRLISLEALDRQVGVLTAAESPSDVFRALLEGTRLAAPRAAVYLIRQGQIKGWGATGFPREGVRQQQGQIWGLEEGWLGKVAASARALHELQPHGLCPDFGQASPAECVGLAVRVKQRPIALAVIERAEGEQPWEPAALGILVRMAQMRLDLDLLRRKLPAGARPAADRSETETPARAEPGPEPAGEAAHELSPIDEAVEPAAQPGTARQEDQAVLQAARRYARLVATDIRLYNEDDVVLGRRNGDLTERLGEHLARGKETFLRRHGALGPAALEILHEAYVQVLAGGDESVLPASVLD